MIISNSCSVGNFDFESTLIEMSEKKYLEDGKWVINQTIDANLISIIMNNSYMSTMLQNQNLMGIYTTLAHEVTHFLDYTTTIWGLEYFFKKKLCQYNNTHKSSEVLNINESELRIHESLCIKNRQSAQKLIDYELRHNFRESNKFGYYSHVVFFDNGYIYHDVPLSMLCVLETHAFVNEQLIRIINLESNKLDVSSELQELEQSFDNYINDENLFEYNLLFILLRKHFHDFTYKQLMLFTKSLLLFVLNMSSMCMASLSQVLIPRKQSPLAKGVYLDMHRGMSRQVMMFELILTLYDLIANGFIDKNTLLNELSDVLSSERIIEILMLDKLISSESAMAELERKMQIKLITEYSNILDPDYFTLKNINTNVDIVKSSTYNVPDLSKLVLNDIFYGDTGIIKSPNRTPIDIKSLHDVSLITYTNLKKTNPFYDNYKIYANPEGFNFIWQNEEY